MYDLIYSRQKDAIQNARRLLSEYPNLSPLTNNPSTHNRSSTRRAAKSFVLGGINTEIYLTNLKT
jgi:hypothetical protein